MRLIRSALLTFVCSAATYLLAAPRRPSPSRALGVNLRAGEERADLLGKVAASEAQTADALMKEEVAKM